MKSWLTKGYKYFYKECRPGGALASTFFLGWGMEKAGAFLHLPDEVLTSLVLLGTLKNYGLAGGLALALFSKKTSVPATVSAVFMIVYIIWLELKLRGNR